jgi:hypothetical protein
MIVIAELPPMTLSQGISTGPEPSLTFDSS